MTELKGYNPEVYTALEIAGKIAKDNSNRYYSGAHLLKALLNKDLSLLKQLEKMDADVYYMEEWAEVRMDALSKSTNILSAEPDPIIDVILNEADHVKVILEKDALDLYCIMVALSTPGVGFSYDQMKTFPITRSELLESVSSPSSLPFVSSGSPATNPIESKSTSGVKGNFLSKYCIHKNLVQQALGSIVGRDMELNAMIEALCRFSKANVMIIGDHGVGKTTLINCFIQHVVHNQVPELLSQVQLFELDFGAVVAGASYKGEVEDRLKNIIRELGEYPKSILIIEEIHSLLANNTGELGIANILKSELVKGLTVISTTTIEEFTKRIEKQQGLAGMFEIIKLNEPDDETTFRMIKQSIQKYQHHHQINVDDATIWESIRLSHRYMKEKSLPESAIDLIDHTMSVLKTAGETFLKEKSLLWERLASIKADEDAVNKEEQFAKAKWFLSDLYQKTKFLLGTEKTTDLSAYHTSELLLARVETLLKKLERTANEKRSHIDVADLAVVIAQKTGIPAGKLQKEEQQKLHNIEEILKQRVVGQDHAIHIISEAILESRSGLSKAGQPIGSFFFLGPTGTGKTELAKSLAEFLFQDENAIIRFDMSEFKEEHSAALLYGAPPGYVGYEEGGLLVNKIRQKPYSIVLFDEIEKAHPSVFDVFLQIMDEGKLHDRLGKEGDFSNAIILFTSNIGSSAIIESFNSGEIPQSAQLMEIMSRHFRPEFLGRLTEILPFAPISHDHALKIFEIHLKKEFLDLLKNLKITIEVSKETQAFLAENGYNSTYGARPLKGIIRSRLRRPLAKKIVSGEVKEGNHVVVSLKGNELVWKVSKTAPN